MSAATGEPNAGVVSPNRSIDETVCAREAGNDRVI